MPHVPCKMYEPTFLLPITILWQPENMIGTKSYVVPLTGPQKFDFRSKFLLLAKISNPFFIQKFLFLTTFLFLDNKFWFVPPIISILTKRSIFNQISIFEQNFDFEHNFDFWIEFRFWTQFPFFTEKFDFD